jgi:tetratricopeptide (TPR) repeat protein/two-component sensor histidine kinase
MKIRITTLILICLISAFTTAVGNTIQLSKQPGKIKSADTARVNYLIRTGVRYIRPPFQNLPVSKAYIDSAVVLCERENIEIPVLLNILRAEYFFAVKDYRKAEEEARISVEKAENTGDDLNLAKSYLFLGKYYLIIGFFQESMDYYNNAIKLSEKEDFKLLIPRAYDGLAKVYNTVGDIDGYRRNLELMIDAGIKGKDTSSMLSGYITYGSSLSDRNRNFIKADSLLSLAFKIASIKKDTTAILYSLSNRGWNFYNEKMYDSSRYYYEKSLKYMPTANSYGNLGNIYRDLGKTDLSISYYQKGIEEAKKMNDLYSLSWIHNDMSNMYLMKKDTGNAYKSYVQFKQFSDSMLKNQNTQGLSDAKIRYEADSRNQELLLLSLRLKNNRLLNYGLAGFILLSIIIGFLLLRSSRHKTQRQISEMKRKISDVTQANLRQQMNPHFIFNTLNSIQYYMYQHDKLATNNYLTKFSSLMRKVLENSQHTSVNLRDEIDALKLYLDLECLRFKDKFDYEIIIDDEIDTLMFKVPAMLIQPYVENSISHGLMPREGKGVIRIELKLEKNHIICTIEDNGIGREAARDMKTRDGNHNSLGTHITSSRLDLVNSLYDSTLKTVYTDLKDENEGAIGTRVEIHIPVMT